MSEEILTEAQIKAKYRDEWVLVSQDMFPDDPEPDGGIVVAHGEDRDEVLSHRRPMGIRFSDFFFTGPPVAPGVFPAL